MHRTYRIQSPHCKSQNATPPNLMQDGFLMKMFVDKMTRGSLSPLLGVRLCSKTDGMIRLADLLEGNSLLRPLDYFLVGSDITSQGLG